MRGVSAILGEMGRNRIEQILNGDAETQAFAFQIAKQLTQKEIIALSGDLGAGKTTFVQGLVSGLGGESAIVQSPTFVYLNHYPLTLDLFHFDLYRMKNKEDFLALGFNEYFEKNGVVVIEWPERIVEILPEQTIHISFHILSSSQRKVVMQ